MAVGWEWLLKTTGLVKDLIANTTFLLSILIFTGTTLFLPDAIAVKMGFDIFRQSNALWIALALLMALAILVSRVFVFIGQQIWGEIVIWHKSKILHDLTPEEKGLLKEYMDGETTINVHMNDGVAFGLARREIVYPPSPFHDGRYGAPLNLQPWAREYLQKNPKLLDGSVPHSRTPKTPRYF